MTEDRAYLEAHQSSPRFINMSDEEFVRHFERILPPSPLVKEAVARFEVLLSLKYEFGRCQVEVQRLLGHMRRQAG